MFVCVLFDVQLVSVVWVVKWCPMSRITTPLARKRPFHGISMKNRISKVARETSKFQIWKHLSNSRRRYMAEILPIRRKTLTNQSIIRPAQEYFADILYKVHVKFMWKIHVKITWNEFHVKFTRCDFAFIWRLLCWWRTNSTERLS